MNTKDNDKNSKYEFEISEKHIPVKIIVFIVALCLAVGGIGFGIYSLIRASAADEGWNNFDLSSYSDSKYPDYEDNVCLSYYLDNNDSSVQSKSRSVNKLLQISAKNVYKYIDGEKSHEYDVKNIGYLNAHPGETVEIHEYLYNVLLDAKEKTYEEGSTYSVFSGVTYYYWQSLFAKNYAFGTNIDPTNNEDTKDTLSLITSYNSDLSNFDLKLENVDGKYYATFTVSQEAIETYEDLGFGDVPVLSLNSLFYSYYLDGIYQEFIKEGFTKGYLYTYTGEMIVMSSYFNANNNLYIYDVMNEKKVIPCGAYINKGKCYVSQIRNFAANATYEYTLATGYYYDSDGNMCFRNSFSNYITGYNQQQIRNSMLVSEDENTSLANLTFENMKLVHIGELNSYKNLPNKTDALVILEKDESTIYLSNNDEEAYDDYTYYDNDGNKQIVEYTRNQL